ncbi:MAG: hypothetical protein HKN37_11890 [Rhodothermales bacterium]|nr:hypothetical protein [Rhodothermales bacterium]
MNTNRLVRLARLAAPLLLLVTLSANAQEASQTSDRERPPEESAALGYTAAISLPLGFYVEDVTPSHSFSTPVAVAFAPDSRIFVAEKRGRVYIIEGGVKLSTPFINLESEVLDHWDRGLLGIALDPDFATNEHVYLLYTYDRDGTGDYQRQDVAARVTRYTASSGNPNVADLTSRLVLIGNTFAEAIPSCYYSHTIGTLQFGSDGSLLVGAGDGADFTTMDPGGLHPDCFGAGKFPAVEDVGAFRAQYLNSLAGKILRIDPATGLGLPSNPFYTGTASDNQSRVWALGLRNPFRFSALRNGSTDPTDGDPGALFIGDVGWNTWEDLHVSKSGGENFGWPCYEGPNTNAQYQAATPAHSSCAGVSSQAAPPYFWHHTNSALSSPPGLTARAVAVGDFYPGSKYPAAHRNRLYYADYIRQWIATAAIDASDDVFDHQEFASDAGNVADLRYDSISDYLYWVDLGSGEVMRLRHVDETVLAVELSSIHATVRDNRVTLEWTTAGDSATTGFSIEHRLSSQSDYSEIGFVAERSTASEPVAYRYETRALDPGSHVFRLRQTDPDGTHTYSRDVEVEVGVGEGFRIDAAWPNPFSARTKLRFAVSHPQRVEAALYDALGRRRAVLFDENVRADEMRSISIEGSDLESGTYVIRLSGERFSAERFVVRLK